MNALSVVSQKVLCCSKGLKVNALSVVSQKVDVLLQSFKSECPFCCQPISEHVVAKVHK